MDYNTLFIDIHRPIGEVFSFIIDPKNTPLWIEHIKEEKINQEPIQQGTIYRNVDRTGVWAEYVVSDFQKDVIFELVASDENYHVRYRCTDLQNGSTRLEYTEWMESGELAQPFTQSILAKLKAIIE